MRVTAICILSIMVIFSAAFAASFGEEFTLSIGEQESFSNGVELQLTEVTKSYIPGEGASVTIDVTDGSTQTFVLGIGQKDETEHALFQATNAYWFNDTAENNTADFIVQKIIECSIGATIQLDTFAAPKTKCAGVPDIELIETEKSYVPGEGGTAKFDIDGSEVILGIGQQTLIDGIIITLDSASVDEVNDIHYATITLTEPESYPFCEAVQLDLPNNPFAKISYFYVELVDVEKSYVPGEGGTATLKIDGTTHTIGIGQFVEDLYDNKELRLLSASVDEVNDIKYATVIVTELYKKSFGQNILLMSDCFSRVKVDGKIIQLVKVENSNVPGEPGSVTFLAEGSNHVVNVGETEVVAGMLLTVHSASVNTGSTVTYQASIVLNELQSYDICEDIQLDIPDHPYALVGSWLLELIDVEKSYIPGEGGTVTVKVNGASHTIGIGQYAIISTSKELYIKSGSVDETSGDKFSTMSITKFLDVSPPVSIELDTSCTRRADLDGNMIELLSVEKSMTPGQGGKAHIKVNEDSNSLSVGESLSFKDYTLTLDSLSVDETKNIGYAQFSISLGTTPIPTVTPTPTVTPIPTAQPTINPPYFPVIQSTTSEVIERTTEGNAERIRVQGNSSEQGYLKLVDVPRRPNTIQFDGTTLPECSVDLLQQCVLNLLGGDNIDTSGCLCWTYNEDESQLEIFYPHSEHIIDIDYGEEPTPEPTVTATPTPAPTSTPEPEESGDNPGLIIGMIVLLAIIAAAIWFFFLKKPPEASSIETA